MKSKEEVKNKVCTHWNSGFCKESQCNYDLTDEDCYIHLQSRHEGIANVETYMDRQGKTRTEMDI